MRLVMMGTGPFAVPTFHALLDSRHEVMALVTQPKRTSRGRPEPPAPMRVVAEERGVPILDFERVNTDEARAALREVAPELLIVADYGQILAPETLAVAPRGGVNLHGSLLPKYRGAAPINWAIWNGDEESGVTTIHMSPAVDSGPCLAQASLRIDPDENAVELEHRLANLGAPLVLDTIEQLERGQLQSLPQDPAAVTKARRLRKTDGEIDWSRGAQAIKNQVRALEPWPRTSTHWLRAEGEPLRLILHRVQVEPGASGPPGEVLVATGADLVVAAGDGALRIESIQPAGKKALSAAEFLRGYPVRPGERFGPASTGG